MKLTSVIIRPIVSEKSLKEEERGRYTFEVTLPTTAGRMRVELKKMYGVDATKVRTIILPGKPKRKGNHAQFKKTPYRKKMIVALKEGQKIDLVQKEEKGK